MFIVHVAQNCIVCHLHQICGDLRSNSTPIRHPGSDWKNRFGHIPKLIRLTFIQYIRGAWWWSRFWLCDQRHQTHGNNSRLLLCSLLFFFFFIFIRLFVSCCVWKQLPAMVLVGMACVKALYRGFLLHADRPHGYKCQTRRASYIEQRNTGRTRVVLWCVFVCVSRACMCIVLYPSVVLFRFGLILPVRYATHWIRTNSFCLFGW